MARDLRSLATLTFQAVHRVSEGSLDLERTPGLRRVQFYGAQIADAGVSTLAHVACATASMPPWDLQSRIEARNGLNGARKSLDDLRGLVKSCEAQGYVSADRVAQLRADIEEAMALVRALSLELRSERTIAA